MAAKKQQTPKKPPREAALDAALALAADKGWASVTMGDIARKAKMKLADLHALFDDKSDILIAWHRRIDHKVLEAFDGEVGGDNPRDALFDILMERFDILNDDRAAAVSILNALCLDPKELVIAFPQLGRSMAWMLDAAGIDTGGMKGAARVAGMGIIYLAVLRVWKDDDSRDMSKTMAALDRYLDRGESIINTIGL